MSTDEFTPQESQPPSALEAQGSAVLLLSKSVEVSPEEPENPREFRISYHMHDCVVRLPGRVEAEGKTSANARLDF
jgi:hypothetical protein